MFTFLNSAILVGLAAVTIPILIHFFTRHKSKTVPFSTLRFLKELQNQQIRRLKIRQILLMILRALLILLLVLAFARPTLRNTNSTSIESGAKITAVLILDNTLSMGREEEGHRLLDAAKKRALEALNFLRTGDEIYILYPQDPPRLAYEEAKYNPETVRQIIEETELSACTTDFVAALNLANEILTNSSAINGEVYLITDMQKAGLKLEQNTNGHSLLHEDSHLYVMPVSVKSPENLAVTEVNIGNQILEKNKVVELRTQIKNFGNRGKNNKLVHLFVDGKRVGQQGVSLEQNASADLVFRFIPEISGFQDGYVALEDDDLAGDNKRYFSFTIPVEIPVLLVGNRPEDTYFLNLALRPEKDTSSYIKIKEISYRDFAREELDSYRVILLSNVPRFDHTQVLKLQNFVRGGGGVMVFIGGDVDLRNYNEGLQKKLQLPALAESIKKTDSEQFLSFGKIDFSHPIFKDMFEDKKQVTSPHVALAVTVEPSKSIDKIIAYSNGMPFLFESTYHEGRIIYVTTGVSNEWSDLTRRGLFVPLVNRSVRYLAGATSYENDPLLVGTEIVYNPDELAPNAALVMEKPDKTEIKIKPEVVKGNYLIRFADTDQMGIYRLMQDSEVLSQWAVNADPVESEGDAFTTSDLKAKLNLKSVYQIDDLSQIEQKLTETRFGREFWQWLIAGALLLLIIEMLLFRDKKQKRVPA